MVVIVVGDRVFDIWFAENVSWGFSPHWAGYYIACMFYGFFGGSSVAAAAAADYLTAGTYFLH